MLSYLRALRTLGGDSAVPTCCVKQIKAELFSQQDLPLIFFLQPKDPGVIQTPGV